MSTMPQNLQLLMAISIAETAVDQFSSCKANFQIARAMLKDTLKVRGLDNETKLRTIKLISNIDTALRMLSEPKEQDLLTNLNMN